jgi:hypothetical protein
MMARHSSDTAQGRLGKILKNMSCIVFKIIKDRTTRCGMSRFGLLSVSLGLCLLVFFSDRINSVLIGSIAEEDIPTDGVSIISHSSLDFR